MRKVRAAETKWDILAARHRHEREGARVRMGKEARNKPTETALLRQGGRTSSIVCTDGGASTCTLSPNICTWAWLTGGHGGPRGALALGFGLNVVGKIGDLGRVSVAEAGLRGW